MLKVFTRMGWALLLIATHASAQPAVVADVSHARHVVSATNQRLPTLRATRFTGQRPGVAYPSELRAWFDGNNVVKLEAIGRDDSGDVVTEFYYADQALVFVYEAVMGFTENATVPKQVTRHEERYYFRDGKLVKWLSGMRGNQTETPSNSKDFAEAARAQLAASTAYLGAAKRQRPQKE